MGRKPQIWNDGFRGFCATAMRDLFQHSGGEGMTYRKIYLSALMVAALATAASAMHEIPKASAKALGVTRGKSFSSGVVFIEGKYIPPPYVVER